MYIKRHSETQVLKAEKNYPVVMVCGQRQAGKSTMLYHIKEDDRKYVTPDDINARRLAEKGVVLFLKYAAISPLSTSLSVFRQYFPKKR